MTRSGRWCRWTRTPYHWLAIALLVGGWLGVCVGTAAQNQRDPTAPPASAALSGAASSNATAAPVPDVGAMAVIVREGRPYLVVGTRLVGLGGNVGSARIERISETEIWLREAGQLRKVPRFTGVQRRANQP